MKDQDKQYLLDLISNIEGASYRCGELAVENDGMLPDLEDEHLRGTDNESFEFDDETWDTVKELEVYKRKVRKIIAKL